MQESTAQLELMNELLRRENAELKKNIASIQRIEEALHKCEDNLQAFMSALPQSCHLIDTDGTLLASNEVSPRRLGISLDKYIGTNIFTHLPPEIAVKRKEYFNRVIHEKTPVSWDDMRENRYYEHYAFPAYDENRNVTRIAHIALDVTDRKKLEEAVHESEEKYRTIVEMSPDAIVIHQQGKVVYTNPATAKLFRLSNPEELIGTDVLDMIHPDFHMIVRENIQNDLEGIKTPPMEVQVIRADKTLATFEGSGRGLLYQGKPAIQVILRDITERKKAEEQLKEVLENLKRSNEDLELFASIASHDLQEPVRTIVNFTQLLLKECSEEMCPSTERYLHIIENACDLR